MLMLHEIITIAANLVYILSPKLLKKMHSVKAQGILLEEELSDFV